MKVDAYLARQVNAGQHDLLWVMVQHAAAEVESLEECQGSPLNLWLEAKCPCELLAELLHLGLIKLGQLNFILNRYCFQLLACFDRTCNISAGDHVQLHKQLHAANNA